MNITIPFRQAEPEVLFNLLFRERNEAPINHFRPIQLDRYKNGSRKATQFGARLRLQLPHTICSNRVHVSGHDRDCSNHRRRYVEPESRQRFHYIQDD